MKTLTNPVGQSGTAPPDQRQTSRSSPSAAINRLVHHATILEMNVDSYRRRAAAHRTAAVADGAATATSDNLADNITEEHTA